MQPCVLVIGGTDSSGGAGVLRDAQCLGTFGVAAACAITSVTAQTHRKVLAVHSIEPQLVAAQVEAALTSQTITAVKIGMLSNAPIVAAVSASLRHCAAHIVLDPVLMSSSGCALLDDEGRRLLLEELMPRVTLVTPNRLEAAELLAMSPASDEQSAVRQARCLPARAVLLKGGHARGEVAIDWFVSDDIELPLSAPRLSVAMRGTGCTLSSAIAAQLALGVPLITACSAAKAHVHELLRNQRTVAPQV